MPKAVGSTTLVLLLLAFVAGPAAGQDMQAYLAETRNLVREGQYQVALGRFIWFHQNALEREPSMAGVRLSFALSDWRRLGETYPPAMNALIETRDATRRQFRDRPTERQLFADLNALNRTLDEENLTIDLFAEIVRESPELAANLRSTALTPVLIDSGRLDLLVPDDLIAQSRLDRYRVERSASSAARVRLLEWYVEESLTLIATALAMGEESTARRIQAEALNIVADQRLQEAVAPLR
jgi:hypothetical protein